MIVMLLVYYWEQQAGTREGRLSQYPTRCSCAIRFNGSTNKGNKRKLSVRKVDILLMKRKRQREEGRFEAMKYIDKITTVNLTWADVLFFDDGKVDSYGKKEMSVGDSEHDVVRKKLDRTF